jgi:hypothetical protein
MRFFRSTWLKRIFLVLFLVFLNAGHFDFIEQQGDRKDELIIHATRFLDELNSPCQQPKIKYGFDVILLPVVTIFKKVISDDFIPGTSLDPFPINPITYPSRSPPRFITIL